MPMRDHTYNIYSVSKKGKSIAYYSVKIIFSYWLIYSQLYNQSFDLTAIYRIETNYFQKKANFQIEILC
jgi:hypothetical protein